MVVVGNTRNLDHTSLKELCGCGGQVVVVKVHTELCRGGWVVVVRNIKNLNHTTYRVCLGVVVGKTKIP